MTTTTMMRRGCAALAFALIAGGPATGVAGQTLRANVPDRPVAALGATTLQAADTVEVIYRRARTLLNEGRYDEAADLFSELRAQYEGSQYVPESYYFEALARYRTERRADMERAMRLLQRQIEGSPDATTAQESQVLLARIQAELAQRGSASAARSIEQEMAQLEQQLAQAETLRAEEARVDAEMRARTEARSEAARAQTVEAQEACEAEWEVRAVALEALYRMDPDRANDMLREILANRDACARTVREMALWLLAERAGQSDTEARDLLIELALEDAEQDSEVREVAMMVLAELDDDAAFAALTRMVEQGAGELGEELYHALAMSGRPEAAEILERRLLAGDVEDEEALVYALAETGGTEVLRRVYPRLGADARAAVVWAVAERDDPEGVTWLEERLADPDEDAEVRAAALYRLADEGALPMSSVLEFYRATEDPDLREQALWVVAEMAPDGDPAPRIDALIEIVETEEDADLRSAALHALTAIDHPRVAEFLEAFLRRGGGAG